MTLRRAVLYIGGACLLIAWFSSAASLTMQRRAGMQPQQSGGDSAPTDGLAAGLEAQGRRLKERLASAPAPPRPVRNPFTFRRSEPVPRGPRGGDEPLVMPAGQAAPAEPLILLVGIAEQRTPSGVVRTAVFATDRDEPILATVGDSVLGHYKVVAIEAGSAELAEIETGRTRRLALQNQ